MQDFLLILTMSVIFIFGWFLMGKVDAFLEEWQKAQEGQHEPEGMLSKYPERTPLQDVAGPRPIYRK